MPAETGRGRVVTQDLVPEGIGEAAMHPPGGLLDDSLVIPGHGSSPSYQDAPEPSLVHPINSIHMMKRRSFGVQRSGRPFLFRAGAGGRCSGGGFVQAPSGGAAPRAGSVRLPTDTSLLTGPGRKVTLPLLI